MQYRLLLSAILLAYICAGPRLGQAQAPAPATATGIPFEAAEVSSPDGRQYAVKWNAPGVRDVLVFAYTDARHPSRDSMVARGSGAGEALVTNLPPAPRWYFRFVPSNGDALELTDRSLHLSTAANFRDAGGYRTAGGKWVRMGLAYRSNGIEHLTDDELAAIERLDIKLVCDLRTAEEINRGPDRVPRGAREISADVLADDAGLIHAMMTGGAGQGREGLEERIYRDFVRLPSAQKAYRALFERLADPAQLPTVFHCTAGKDRTGWAQAVFLTMLGVPRATVVEDYELTNRYLQGAAAGSVRQSMGQNAPSSITANSATLDAAFDQVMQDYGSFDAYLSRGLRLSDAAIAAIRKNFLME